MGNDKRLLDKEDNDNVKESVYDNFNNSIKSNTEGKEIVKDNNDKENGDVNENGEVNEDADEMEKEKKESKKEYEERIEEDNPLDANLIEYQEILANDPNNESLTRFLLTRQLAYEYSNIRTHANQGLGQCVYVNVNNPKVKCPYATSPDCYNTFGDFFGEVIERIHGIPDRNTPLEPKFGISKHGNCIDLNSFDRKRERVIYTEISVRRNIQNVPFTPFMNSGERKTVISMVEPKLREYFKECEELPWMPVDWEKRLDEIKNELDDVGSMKEYPEDRLNLVFINDKNIFLGCVFNFDDHLQFLVSSYDGRIGDLSAEIAHIYTAEGMEDIEYTAHPVYGHLTLNPSYVGTAFNIRILAKFPFVSRLSDVNALVADFDVCVKKEVDNRNTGLVYMTNIKTLNKNETDILRDIVRAFNKLSIIEDEMEVITPMSVQDDNMAVENLYRVRDTIIESKTMTYTKKYLTENVLFDTARVKTNFDTILTHCIRHNAYNPKSLFPRACDMDCYFKFENFFNPILLETNNTKGFNHKRRPIYGSTAGDKRFLLHHPNIYSYRVRFSRNIAKFPFPNNMSDQDRRDVERIMMKIFNEAPVELEGEYCPVSELKHSIYLEDILAYKIISTPNVVDMSAGYYRDWPKHRGVYIIKPHDDYPCIFLVVSLNIKDHIKVVAYNPTGIALNMAYDRATQLLKYLDLRLENLYAKRSGYGFLTSTPNNVGCGMRVSAMVKFRKLGDKREIFENLCRDAQFTYRGTSGHGSPAIGNVFDLSFKYNLNVTEEYVPMIFVQRLKELILEERKHNPIVPKPSNADDDYDDYNFDSSTESGEFDDLLETDIITKDQTPSRNDTLPIDEPNPPDEEVPKTEENKEVEKVNTKGSKCCK